MIPFPKKARPDPDAFRKFRTPDLSGVSRFLHEREETSAGLTGRLMRSGKLDPSRVSSGILFVRSPASEVTDVLWLSSGGALYPVFSSDRITKPGTLSKLILSRTIVSSIIGKKSDVDLLANALQLESDLAIDYSTMSLDTSEFVNRSCLPDGFGIRLASPRDLDSLLPLQEAYEREEVVTRIHIFDRNACARSFAHVLKTQLVAIVLFDGKMIAKANTNARAKHFDQIGGVYVDPKMRGRGIGKAVVSFLLARIALDAKNATLFVKKDNAPAASLYSSLGFAEKADFRIDYFASR